MRHAHEHADLSHMRAALQTTHAIHEVHVSPHAILTSISHVYKFNDIIMYMVIDYRNAFRIIGNDHIRYRSTFLHAWYHENTTLHPRYVFAWTTFTYSV